MSSTTSTPPVAVPVDGVRLNQFLERALNDLAAGYGGVMISLGRRLGLYRAMAGAGPLSSQELASRTGCADCCGNCEDLAAQIFHEALVHSPNARPLDLPVLAQAA